MAKGATLDGFKRNDKVKALEDLPGVPAGTRGRIYLVNGFTWTRYRVLFDNGVDIGSIDGSVLVAPKEYEAALRRRDEAVHADEESAASDEAVDDGGAAGGEGKSVNGVTVPARLLDRSKKARERLGA